MFNKAMVKCCAKPKTKAKGIVEESKEKKKIKGTVILMKKNVLDMHDLKASLLDRVYELLGKGVSLQLISAVHSDPGKFLSFLFLCFFSVLDYLGIFQDQEYTEKKSVQSWWLTGGAFRKRKFEKS